MDISKLINAVRCGSSYAVSLALKNPVVYGLPPYIGVELTNICNLSCPECSSGSGMMSRDRGYMDPALFTNIMNQLRKTLLGCNLYFQGEPLLHPEFTRFLHETGEVHKTISTNGHYLTVGLSEAIVRSGPGKIIISMDGMDQETYSRYRKNGNLEKVKEAIRTIVAAEKKYNSGFRIDVQMLVNSFNEHQVTEFRQYAKEAGVRPVLKSMQICHREAFEYWLPSVEKFRRYRISGGNFNIKSSMPRRCSRLWFVPVITWDGKVLPCCFDKDASYVMGDLAESTFREIWEGERFRKFRKDVLTGRDKIDICRNCTVGLRL